MRLPRLEVYIVTAGGMYSLPLRPLGNWIFIRYYSLKLRLKRAGEDD